MTSFARARRRSLAAVLALAGLVAPVLTAATAAPAGAATSTIVDAVVRQWLPTTGLTGVEVSVVRADGGHYDLAVGTQTDGTPMSTADRFDLSSVTKSFTTALVWRAVDQGLIDPDAPVGALPGVPGWPYAGRFTVRQLLSHETGLVNYRDTPQWNADPSSIATPQQALAASGSQPLQFEPGTGTAYSSSNFLVLGMLLEQVTGRTYDDLLRNDLLLPLGLTKVTHDPPRPAFPNFSTAGVMATTGETAAWFDALIGRNGAGLSADSYAAMLDQSSGSVFTAGLWNYCPCSDDDDGPHFYAIGNSGSEMIVYRVQSTGLTIVVHANDQIWDPATRNSAVQDLMRAIDLVEQTGKPPATMPIALHVGQPNTVYVGNLTITQPATAGYATIYPCAAGLPPTSNINFAAGQTVANLTLTTTDASGNLCVTPSADAHVIFDQTATLSGVTSYPAQRALDTRRSPRPAARATVRIHVGQPNTVYVGNLTITQPATAGYATIYPCAAGLPPTSNINFAADQTVANLTLTTTDAAGDICVTPSTAAHVIFDQTGTVGSIAPHAPVRVIDTRN